jgi:hypothetical protein
MAGVHNIVSVFLLWHSHDLGDGETDDKLLGVYSSREAVERRVLAARNFQGLPSILTTSKSRSTPSIATSGPRASTSGTTAA